MKLLNLGCGFTRPGPPWINVDTLRTSFPEDRVMVDSLNREQNYLEHDLRTPLPFEADSVDGIFASHLLEHLDCQEAYKLLENCRRVLAPGGIICVGVPSAAYHRKVWPEDTRANSMRLFGEIIDDGDRDSKHNLGRALFFSQHKQVFSEDSLWCHFVMAGFAADKIKPFDPGAHHPDVRRGNFATISNRRLFTLFMEAEK